MAVQSLMIESGFRIRKKLCRVSNNNFTGSYLRYAEFKNIMNVTDKKRGNDSEKYTETKDKRQRVYRFI